MRVCSQCFHQFLTRGNDSAYVFSFLHHFADRVEIERAFQLFRCISFFLEIGYQQLCQLQRVTLAGREVQFHTFAADVFQQSIEVFCIEFFGFDMESE